MRDDKNLQGTVMCLTGAREGAMYGRFLAIFYAISRSLTRLRSMSDRNNGGRHDSPGRRHIVSEFILTN